MTNKRKKRLKLVLCSGSSSNAGFYCIPVINAVYLSFLIGMAIL